MTGIDVASPTCGCVLFLTTRTFSSSLGLHNVGPPPAVDWATTLTFLLLATSLLYPTTCVGYQSRRSYAKLST